MEGNVSPAERKSELREQTSFTIYSANISWAAFLFSTILRCSGAKDKLYKVLVSKELCFIE